VPEEAVEAEAGVAKGVPVATEAGAPEVVRAVDPNAVAEPDVKVAEAVGAPVAAAEAERVAVKVVQAWARGTSLCRVPRLPR
jgi:hypothetical protein